MSDPEHDADNTSTSESSSEKQNRQRLRLKAFEELVNSEQKYVTLLEMLISHYLTPFLDKGGLISASQHNAIFSGIKMIHNCNVQFNQTLQKKSRDWNNQQSLIGDEMQKFVPMLRMYEDYVSNHENRHTVLHALQSDSKFVRMCNDAKNKCDTTHTLDDLLLLPIQRGSRYEMILKEIVSNTEKTHPDYDTLLSAIKDISKVNRTINDIMKKYSERETLRRISVCIKNPSKDIELVSNDRKFIKNGWLIKMGKNRPQKYLFFLFSDLMFYCKPDGNTTSSATSATTPTEEKDPAAVNTAAAANEGGGHSAAVTDTSSSTAPAGASASAGTAAAVAGASPQTSQTSANNPAAIVVASAADDNPHNSGGGGANTVRKRKFSHDNPSSVSHDYSHDNEAMNFGMLFGNRKARKSRTKMYDSASASETDDELTINSFNMQIEIHNDFDVNRTKLPGLKVHNYLWIDASFRVEDFRLLPQRYDNLAFEIHSKVKSFIVMAPNEQSKKEWMTLLTQCSNQFRVKFHKASRSDMFTPATPTPMTPGSNTKAYAATLYLPDSFTDKCMKCNKSFNVTRRKKHCHHCGQLICSRCLTQKLPAFNTTIDSKNTQPLKVCEDCYSTHKHLFPDFAEAAVFSSAKMSRYKQRATAKKKKTAAKKKKKNKFRIGFGALSKHRSVNEEEPMDDPVVSLDPGHEYGDDEYDDDESEKDIELSMSSIPENNDFIDRMLYTHADAGGGGGGGNSAMVLKEGGGGGGGGSHHSVEMTDAMLGGVGGGGSGGHLAPPQWAMSAQGRHYHNKSESGFADDDEGSAEADSDDYSSMTPPISDAEMPTTPFYDDTSPLQLGDRDSLFGTGGGGGALGKQTRSRNSFHLISPPPINVSGNHNASGNTSYTFPSAINMSPLVQSSMIANPFDSIPDHTNANNSNANPINTVPDTANNPNAVVIDGQVKNGTKQFTRPQGLLRVESGDSYHEPLEPVLEDDSDLTSANDVDPNLSSAHIKNLSLHVVDQLQVDYEEEDFFNVDDDYEKEYSLSHNRQFSPTDGYSGGGGGAGAGGGAGGGGSFFTNNLSVNRIVVNDSLGTITSQQLTSPGNTPPPVSPRRYKKKPKHKRKLSDKIDRFLKERPNPERMLQQGLLLSHPQEDYITNQQASHAVQDKKAQERQRIQSKLRRKLSGDFRPSMDDITARGIALMPDRSSSSGHGSGSGNGSGSGSGSGSDGGGGGNRNDTVDGRGSKARARASADSVEHVMEDEMEIFFDRSETAKLLYEQRKRKSAKIEELLLERPTPSDIIEKGIISARDINDNIPVSPSTLQQLERVKAECAFEMHRKSQIQLQFHALKIRSDRRAKILSFYDKYLFNSIMDSSSDSDDDNTHPHAHAHKYSDNDIVVDTVDIIDDYNMVLQYIENNNRLHNQSYLNRNGTSASMAKDDLSLEKEWMRNLRKRKFRIYSQQQKLRTFIAAKNQIANQLTRIKQTMELKLKFDCISNMEEQVSQIKTDRFSFLNHASQEMNELRAIIKQLSNISLKYSQIQRHKVGT